MYFNIYLVRIWRQFNLACRARSEPISHSWPIKSTVYQYTVSELASDFEQFQKKRNDLNKLNYDKNSKINNSKFEKGQKIVFLKDNVWVPANIVEPHSSPRSFLIKDAAGNVLRRNTSQLKPSNTDVTINEELTDCPVQYDENLHNSELQNPVPDQPVSTSGRPKRTVRPPAYLNDYYTSIPSREDV
ncbi:hypothetical protein ACJJTC_003377 [Scirpophaga incertulas]